jgi:hypothetical protein
MTKLADAAWNQGLARDGMSTLSYRVSDSTTLNALPKPYLNTLRSAGWNPRGHPRWP